MAAATAVCASAVSAVHLGTRGRVRLNEELFLQRAVLEAAGLTVPQAPAAAAEAFRRGVEERKDPEGRPAYYLVRKSPGGEVVAYVLPAGGAGLWGRIEAVVGLEPDLRTVRGLVFTRQNETPGLGAKIAEQPFRQQFEGQRGPFRMRSSASGDGFAFDAVTGATTTSAAVRDLLNRVMEEAPGTVRSGRR
jgi:Na+-transporting NADH:ubiquinone oxidoreductase subunit C